MKKNQHHFMYLCVLIISIFTLFMVGCNKAMSDISVGESNVSSDISQKSESANDSRPKTIGGRKEDLRFLQSSNNNLGTYNTEGFYRLITLSEDASNIVYIDFKNEQVDLMMAQLLYELIKGENPPEIKTPIYIQPELIMRESL